METIASFQVDHTNLQPGIYISRQDMVAATIITTYDIRMTAPNTWKDNIIYWGPMGCLTGNYLIVKGKYPCEEIRELMIDAFTFVRDFDGEVPGTTAATCGNYLIHDLPMAKWESTRYIERLKNNFCCEYPGVARPTVGDGMTFFDA